MIEFADTGEDMAVALKAVLGEGFKEAACGGKRDLSAFTIKEPCADFILERTYLG
jgi:hypothetical protein